ncbi:hypothetical protein [Sphingomonas albertensis]|uniref:hypothetical protein n=1 Tax=Sphingomonas albertensis TaxID=2762591 RepID=UPI0037D9BCBB
MAHSVTPHPHQQEPTMGLLEELAVRCEAATEGTPMLENEIAKLMNDDGWHAADCMRQFTRSIDAALTLVPVGLRVLIDSDGCHCRITDPHGEDDKLPWNGVASLAHSMALATCAASLRARHALALSKGSEG